MWEIMNAWLLEHWLQVMEIIIIPGAVFVIVGVYKWSSQKNRARQLYNEQLLRESREVKTELERVIDGEDGALSKCYGITSNIVKRAPIKPKTDDYELFREIELHTRYLQHPNADPVKLEQFWGRLNDLENRTEDECNR